MAVQRCDPPAHALLRDYAARGYTDGFCIELPFAVSQAAYVEAFYTSWVFKLERALLAAALSRPSTDAQAAQLAQGRATRFAAWDVEARSDDQLLLRDLHGKTRSWLMSEPLPGGRTRLRFGSAVTGEVVEPHAVDPRIRIDSRMRDESIPAGQALAAPRTGDETVRAQPAEVQPARARARFRLGGTYRVLLGLHVLYSRVLLAACAARLRRGYDRAPRP